MRKVELGRAMARFPTTWYERRHKILKALDLVGIYKRPAVFEAWKKWLTVKSKDFTVVDIAEETGLSKYALYQDQLKLGIRDEVWKNKVYTFAKEDVKQNPVACVKECFGYNKKTGEVTRLKAGSSKTLYKVDKVIHNAVSLCSIPFTLRQLIYILHTGETPNGRIVLLDKNGGDVFSNFGLAKSRSTSADATAHKETYKLPSGKVVTLLVDSSRPRQPKGSANVMRVNLMCRRDGVQCKKYNTCMDTMFTGDCLGYTDGTTEANAKMQEILKLTMEVG